MFVVIDCLGTCDEMSVNGSNDNVNDIYLGGVGAIRLPAIMGNFMFHLISTMLQFLKIIFLFLDNMTNINRAWYTREDQLSPLTLRIT